MGKIAIPKGPNVYSISIREFLGADFTNAPSYVSKYRSPDMQNMIRESRGKIRKWIGWHTVNTYDGRINGFHLFKDSDGTKLLVHAGTKLYYYGDTETVIYSDMNNERSVSRQLNGKLVIADGKKLIIFGKFDGNFTVKTAESQAYTPTIVINRKPSGGGTTYEPVNLLGKARIDSFYADGTSKDYQLSATNIDRVTLIQKLDGSGNKVNVGSGEYSVNTSTGKVTFNTAPAVSPVTGQDNIYITYEKTVAGYADKINQCDIMTLYGVNGARDRIFLAGDKKNGNRDYYCQMDNPCYWGDLWYLTVGQDNSNIVGYSVINDKLAAHLDRSDDDTNIVMRIGDVNDKGDAQFKLAGSYQGGGALSKYGFANLETEPIFITKDGIMAVTPSDVLGERYAQLRSYYLNGKLLKEDLKNAVCCTFDRFYMCAVGGHIYALDGTQASVENNVPYSNRQYEGFYRTNVPARVIYNNDGVLTFGTEDGRVCEFYNDYESIGNFNDDGAPIYARWTTPELAEVTSSSSISVPFYYKKRFKSIAVMLGAYVATSLLVKCRYDGTEEIVLEPDNEARFFSYSHFAYSKFTYKTDDTAQIIKEKISIKPDNKKAQFIFENDVLNEAFALYQCTIELTGSK